VGEGDREVQDSRPPRSNKQLLRLFYEELKLPVQFGESKKDKKTGKYKKPQPTVDAKALAALKDLHPIADELRYFRAFDKAYGTYVEGILSKMVDGRIYPSFNVTGTDTGRISHSDPNMGNLPSAKKAKELDEPHLAGLRGMFIPDPGCVLISADFSQLEVCLSAHFTRDANLLRIINEGVSQHDITAEGLGIERSLAKTVNFGMQYGCSYKKVAKVLKVSDQEGKRAYDKYWETYSGQKARMDECAAKVDRGEPIINPFGRRRRFEVRKRESWDSAYRQAWNALVQGTGSDCTSRAFYLADASLRRRGIGRALFTVHDEILIQARAEHAEEAQAILVEAMISVGKEIGLTVPLKAEASGAMERWSD
jgi:DNA polymerase-1